MKVFQNNSKIQVNKQEKIFFKKNIPNTNQKCLKQLNNMLKENQEFNNKLQNQKITLKEKPYLKKFKKYTLHFSYYILIKLI